MLQRKNIKTYFVILFLAILVELNLIASFSAVDFAQSISLITCSGYPAELVVLKAPADIWSEMGHNFDFCDYSRYYIDENSDISLHNHDSGFLCVGLGDWYYKPAIDVRTSSYGQLAYDMGTPNAYGPGYNDNDQDAYCCGYGPYFACLVCRNDAVDGLDSGDDPFTGGLCRDYNAYSTYYSSDDTVRNYGCGYSTFPESCSGDTLTEYYASGTGCVQKSYNCNDYDGNYCVGTTKETRDYYCDITPPTNNYDGCVYTVTASEDCNSYDGWYNYGNTAGCGNDPTAEYRDYTCSGGSCTYSVTSTTDCDSSDKCSGICNTATGDIEKLDYYVTSSGSCTSYWAGLVQDCSDTCSDSDGGISYFSTGTTTDYELCSSGQTSCPSTSATDSCGTGNVLTEYYCNGADRASTTKDCDDYDGCSSGTYYDYSCSSGKCVSSAMEGDSSSSYCCYTWFSNLGTGVGNYRWCCGDDGSSDDFATYSGSLTTSTQISCRRCLNGADQGTTTLYGNGYYTGSLTTSTSLTCYYGDITCTATTASNGASKTLYGNGYYTGSLTTSTSLTCYYGDITCGDGTASNGASTTLYGNGYFTGSVTTSTSGTCYYGDITCGNGVANNGASTTLYGNGYFTGSVTTSTSGTCYYGDITCGNGVANNGARTTLYGNGYWTGTTCYYGNINCGNGVASNGASVTMKCSYPNTYCLNGNYCYYNLYCSDGSYNTGTQGDYCPTTKVVSGVCYYGTRTCNSAGRCSYSSSNSPPNAPSSTSISPACGTSSTIMTAQATVSDPNGDSVKLQVCKDSSCATVLCTSNAVSSGSTASCTFTASSACSSTGTCTVYYRTIEASADPCGLTKSSSTVAKSFNYDISGPNAPTGLSPASGTWTSDTTPTLSWNAATDVGCAGVDHYEVYVYASSDCSGTAIRSSTSVTGTSWTPSALSEGTYSWRVRAVDNFNHIGSWSSCNIIKIDTSAPVYGGSSITQCRYLTGSTCWVIGGDTFKIRITHSDNGQVYRQYLAFNKDDCTPNNCGGAPYEIKSYTNYATSVIDVMADDTQLNINNVQCVDSDGSCSDTDITAEWSTVVGSSANEWDYKIHTFSYDSALNGVGYTDTGFWLKIDQTPPSGSVDYPNTIYTINSVRVYVSASDTRSGVATAQLQYQTAVLNSDDSCGTFGSWNNIGNSDPSKSYVDVTLSSNLCYKFRYVITDNVGHQFIATSSSVLKVRIGASDYYCGIKFQDPSFYIKTPTKVVGRIDYNGNLLITSQSVNFNVASISYPSNSFIIRRESGEIVCSLNEVNADFKGQIYSRQATVSNPNGNDMLVKRCDGINLALFTETGDVYIKGYKVYDGSTDPCPSSYVCLASKNYNCYK